MNAKTKRNPERDLFCRALDIDVIDRDAWLQAQCADDTDLLERLRRLLQKHGERDSGEHLNIPGSAADKTYTGGTAVASGQAVDSDQTLLGDTEATGRDGRDDEFDIPVAPSTRRRRKREKNGSVAQVAEHEIDRIASSSRLRHYNVLETIGRGAMGVVLKAEDTRLKRTVAIKVTSSQAIPDESTLERFEREAQLAAAVQHENLVTIHAVDRVDGNPFIVMEYVDGVTLRERIKNGDSLNADEILGIMRQLATGLAAAHDGGMIHRDIKPGNIMIERDTQKIRIVDFGLARGIDDPAMTAVGSVVGTPHYISPEQAQGLDVDHRADLFSMGCVLYAMYAKESPFHAKSIVAVLQRVCFEKEKRLSTIVPSVPSWQETLIHRMLSKNPDLRPQSASEVLRTIEENTRPVPEVSAFSVKRFLLRTAAVIAATVGLLAVTDAAGVTNVGGTVMRLARGHGTVEIRVHEPGMEVSVDGDNYNFTSTNDLSISLHAPPGRHVVEARRDGKLFRRKIFTLERFGREVIEMTWEAEFESAPNSSLSAPGTPYFAADDWSSPRLVNLGTSTGVVEGRPSVSADGCDLYFESNRIGAYGRTDLWLAHRETADADFGPAKNLGSEINTGAKECDPVIANNGLLLLFSASSHRGGFGKNEIWQASRSSVAEPFGTPERIKQVNSEASDASCSLSSDGLILIFSSSRKGGMGESDLWIARRESMEDHFSNPAHLGPVVNSKYRDSSPFLSRDGLELWFVSDRPGTYGRRDIWVSRRESTADAFGTPLNAGPTINSAFIDEGPTLSADGQLFFESMRPVGSEKSGTENIWTCRRMTQVTTPSEN